MDLFRTLKMKYACVQDHDYSSNVKSEDTEVHYDLMQDFQASYLKIRTISDINAASILLDLSRPQEEPMDLTSPCSYPTVSPTSYSSRSF